jgi:hypothetical protein
MDAVAGSQPGSDGGNRHAVAAFDRTVLGLKDSAELARLTDDPAAPSLLALLRVLESMGAQFRLRDRDRQAMAVALEQRVARLRDEAMARVEASGANVVERLAPDLSRLVERSVRQRLWIVRLRTVLISAGGAVGLVLLSLAAGYGIGFQTGHTTGLNDGKTVVAAMAAGPAAADSWARLMADNDPVAALKACRNSGGRDASGRHYCLMPVWLDPPSAPPEAKRN